jgi:hypothetical protein
VHVFVSYRRDDVPDATDRLADSLINRLGKDDVFLDVDNIDIGARFATVVRDWVGRCDVLLAVMGRGWLDATDEDGGRRLENPRDYVRLEIESALERDIRVVPVLIHGARIPKEVQLPESLVPLLERNAIELSRAHWDADVERLVTALERVGAERSRQEAAERERAERERARSDAAAREQAQRQRAAEAAQAKQARPEPAPTNPPDRAAAAKRATGASSPPSVEKQPVARPEVRARETGDPGRFAGAIGVLPWLVIVSGLATVLTTFAHWYDDNAVSGATHGYDLWAPRVGIAAGILTCVCVSVAIVAWTSLRPSRAEPRTRRWMLAVAAAASLTAAVLAFAALSLPSGVPPGGGYYSSVNNGVVVTGMACAVLMTVCICLLWASPALVKRSPPHEAA